jgi:phosphate transport system protein
MASIVDEQIELATRALFESNDELAKLVIDGDEKVNKYDNLIDQQCETLFAITQPVAVDLRLLMATLKINSDLERIGDIAVNIAERAISLKNQADLIGRTRLTEMSQISRKMVKDSIDSFIHADAGLAKEVCQSDDAVDNLDKEIFEYLVNEMKRDSEVVVPASHLIVLVRHLERLADHATNIAEDVVFLVGAKIIKHHAQE